MDQYFMSRKILKKYGNLSPSAILRYFTTDTFFEVLSEDTPWAFVILGRPGPTGKTWLCRELQGRGFTAIELSESISLLVDYRDNGNHVVMNDVNKTIVIVLNHSLKGE